MRVEISINENAKDEWKKIWAWSPPNKSESMAPIFRAVFLLFIY